MQKFTYRQYSLEKRDNVCKARDNVYGMKIYFVDENTDNNLFGCAQNLKKMLHSTFMHNTIKLSTVCIKFV